MIACIMVCVFLVVIRPPTSHPHTRGLKKNDPVNRYHQFQHLWASYKPPGERARNSLRWSIRVCVHVLVLDII